MLCFAPRCVLDLRFRLWWIEEPRTIHVPAAMQLFLPNAICENIQARSAILEPVFWHIRDYLGQSARLLFTEFILHGLELSCWRPWCSFSLTNTLSWLILIVCPPPSLRSRNLPEWREDDVDMVDDEAKILYAVLTGRHHSLSSLPVDANMSSLGSRSLTMMQWRHWGYCGHRCSSGAPCEKIGVKGVHMCIEAPIQPFLPRN